MPRLLYFAYGANLDPEAMRRRAPSARPVGPARLRGYRRAFTVRSPYWGALADLLEEPEGEVWGLLYELEEADLARLDAFEDCPNLYTRFTVTVEREDGRPVPGVWVYAVRPERREGEFPPGLPYRRILEEAGRRFRLPQSVGPEAEEARRWPSC